MLSIQDEKTNRRNELRLLGKDEIEEIIKQINDGQENNILLQAMLLDLSKRLKNHKGKLVYGYLNKGDKYVVDRIIDQIEKIPSVKELYDLWYEKQEAQQFKACLIKILICNHFSSKQKGSRKTLNPLQILVIVSGFEPLTYRLGASKEHLITLKGRGFRASRSFFKPLFSHLFLFHQI